MQAYGQDILMQVVSSSGGYYKDASSGLNISWTLGEPVIATLAPNGVDLMLTQGFQQGNLFGTDVPIPDFNSLQFKMYPNPAVNKVYFEVDNKDAKGTFTVEVFDITGRKIILENLGQFTNLERKSLPVSSLKPGIYLVKVIIGNYTSEITKLIKE
jgi:hypothetical protein